jgi:hypothetical protein
VRSTWEHSLKQGAEAPCPYFTSVKTALICFKNGFKTCFKIGLKTGFKKSLPSFPQLNSKLDSKFEANKPIKMDQPCKF